MKKIKIKKKNNSNNSFFKNIKEKLNAIIKQKGIGKFIPCFCLIYYN